MCIQELNIYMRIVIETDPEIQYKKWAYIIYPGKAYNKDYFKINSAGLDTILPLLFNYSNK